MRRLVRHACLLSVPAALAAQAPRATPVVDLAASAALVARVVPEQANLFRVEQIPADSGLDVFRSREPFGAGRPAWIERCRHRVSPQLVPGARRANRSGEPAPARSPATHPSQPCRTRVRVTTPYRIRYFFNYCTFSYTMAWWDWAQWQRMIDWMALKGINTPLAVTGQEGVWRLVLSDLGFSKKMIGDFLVGPAYLPWGWMGNIDGLGGPLPDSWIDSHVELEQKILARERSLGMTPVLQGFTGHVPESIAQVFPEAEIHKTGDWSAGFSGTWFLDPVDPLFQRIGKRFIERQTELFGSDHLYAADSFNEIDPPSDDSTFLAGMGRAVYQSMQSADTAATWVLQGWFLYYQAKFWQEPQARALLGAVPDDHMLVLDLWGDRHPVWRTRSAFYGKPWIWNVLYNFGGKVSLNGDLPKIAANLGDVVASPDKGKLAGIGMMMEGLGTNPVVPDFVMDMTWRTDVPSVDSWTREYVAAPVWSARLARD